MRAIYIHCPETGLAVDTGLVSETAQLNHITLQGTIEICPACQDRHHWTTEEAWLAAERVAPAPGGQAEPRQT